MLSLERIIVARVPSRVRTAMCAGADAEPAPRLTGDSLRLARIAWLFLLSSLLLAFVIAIPVGFDRLMTNADPASLQVLGLSTRAYAAYLVLLRIAVVVIYLLASLLIVSRRSDDWLVLASSLAMTSFVVIETETFETLQAAFPVSTPLLFLLRIIGLPLLTLVMMTFPTGRFFPSWSWIAVPVALAVSAAAFVLRELGASSTAVILVIAWQVVMLSAQVHRFRAASSPIYRQQAKWVMTAVVVAAITVDLFAVATRAMPPASPERYAMEVIGIPLAYLGLLVVPAAVAFSILHHHLYQIDMVIQRAVVYVPLTAILAGILAVVLTIAQAGVVAVTGVRSEMVTAVATLVVVAVFEPLRAGLQGLVDRAFKDVVDPVAAVGDLEREVRQVVDVSAPERLARRTLEVVTRAYAPVGAAVLLVRDGALERVASTPGWRGEAALAVPIQAGGRRVGTISLGPQRSGSAYAARDEVALASLATTLWDALAPALERSGETPPIPAGL
jgi:hypothetical protein